MVTIRDIARSAGVSPMTVSNVLNNRPSVRDSTRTRVLRTIDDLGYRVNVAARNLRRGTTRTIGLAVPEIDRPYFGQLAAAVIEESERHGLRVVIEQTGSTKENELAALASSRLRMYDGLILSTVGLGESDVSALQVDFPVVLLGERIFKGPVDHVAMANGEGAYAAVAHLIDRGCRRIAALLGRGKTETDVSSLRRDGYFSAIADSGLPHDHDLLLHLDEFSLDRAAESVRSAVLHGIAFDGLFCATDYVAIGALRGLADAGLTVPGDVKVIGFDDIELARYLTPSLSSVRPDHRLMASRAVDLLADRIAGSDAPPIEFISPFRISERESTR